MAPHSSDRHPSLPRVPGPKLEPFTPTAHVPIKFMDAIGRSNDRDSHVWKVEIGGKHSALKMFKFNTWKYLWSHPARYLTRPLAQRQFYFDYFDPFSCECRVYGRLKKEGREDLAVKAHGYLLLTAQQEAEVTKKITGWDCELEPDSLDGSDIWDRCEEHQGQEIPAIVKELVTDDDGKDCPKAFDPAQLPCMWEDLKALHSLGILVRDIHSGNYLCGKLVDFSRAWTMHHPCLVYISAYDIGMFRAQDPHQMEKMFLDSNPPADLEVPQELQVCADGEAGCGNDPREYPWLERDGEEVAVHVAQELFS